LDWQWKGQPERDKMKLEVIPDSINLNNTRKLARNGALYHFWKSKNYFQKTSCKCSTL